MTATDDRDGHPCRPSGFLKLARTAVMRLRVRSRALTRSSTPGAVLFAQMAQMALVVASWCLLWQTVLNSVMAWHG